MEKVADFDGAAQTGAIDDPVRWHMIGQLQRNKARSVAKWAYAIHSVDSARLVDALDRAALSALSDGERTEPLRALIQVSLDGDPARGGVPTGELTPLAERIESAEGLEFAGLMAVPPLGSDPDEQFEIPPQGTSFDPRIASPGNRTLGRYDRRSGGCSAPRINLRACRNRTARLTTSNLEVIAQVIAQPVHTAATGRSRIDSAAPRKVDQ